LFFLPHLIFMVYRESNIVALSRKLPTELRAFVFDLHTKFMRGYKVREVRGVGGGVVWCGVVWCGVVWCGVVWWGVVWCGVVWCGVVWCDVQRLPTSTLVGLIGLPSSLYRYGSYSPPAGTHPPSHEHVPPYSSGKFSSSITSRRVLVVSSLPPEHTTTWNA